MEINVADVVLCEFYFSDLKTSKKRPVLAIEFPIRRPAVRKLLTKKEAHLFKLLSIVSPELPGKEGI